MHLHERTKNPTSVLQKGVTAIDAKKDDIIKPSYYNILVHIPGKNIHPLAEERGGDEPEGVHDGEGVPHLLLSFNAGLCTGVS
jgi:hypothetical protein